MGCGSSKKKKEETSATKKSDKNGDKENKDQQNDQNENAENPEDPNSKRKTKKKKGTKGEGLAGVDDDNEYLDKRKKNEFLEFSNLDDLPEYRGDNPRFNFRDGELSPIDENKGSMNPKGAGRKHGSQALNSFEQEVINKFTSLEPKAKKIKVKRHKTSDFNWPDRGELEIKTISYKVVYNHEIKGFRTLKAKDQYITSLLTWRKNEEDDLYNFGIKDTAFTNLRSGNSTEISTPQMNFDVDIDGKFLGIKELDKFVEGVLNLQSSGKVTESKQKQLQKTILEELEKAWNLMVQQWVYLSRPENQELIVDVRQQYGFPCALCHKVTSTDDQDYRAKLKEKLHDANSYYKILSSNKMIRDNFRKWELHKDSTTAKPKIQSPDSEQLLPHRNLKLNFIFTDKDEIMTVLNEPSTVRPLMSNYENSKKIIFEVNRDIYIDVEYESKMSLYLWKGVEELQSDEFLIAEMVKFQDACDVALGDMLADLSTVPRVPLKFRVGPTVSEKKAEQEIEPREDGDISFQGQ